MTYYVNTETGEVLTYRQMIQQAFEEYDIEDDTSAVDLTEYYKKI